MQLERERLLLRVVDLVRDHQHRLVRLSQNLCDLFVTGGNPRLRIHDEEDEVGFGHGFACLVRDRARDRRRVGDVDAARVDEEEALAAPLADQLLAVARHARRLVHDGGARAGEPVDERRLADVREADDRDGPDQRRAVVAAVLGRRALSRACSTSHSPKPSRFPLDLRPRGYLVASQVADPPRLAPGDRARVEVAELPVLRAVDRAADDRHVLLHRDHRGAGLHLARHARPLARPLDEDAERAAVAHDLAHLANRFAVGLAAADCERPELADELAETGNARAPPPSRRRTCRAGSRPRRAGCRSRRSG